jgi:hypothetical protein
MNIIKIQSKWEASRRSPAMTELQDGPGQLRVSVTQVIGQCSKLKPVLTDMEGRINAFKQLRGSAREISFRRADPKRELRQPGSCWS